MRNGINDRDETIDSKPGTFVSDVFVCPTADEIAALYSDLKLMEVNQSVLTATLGNLDRLGRNYFTFRGGATKSGGKLRFYITGTNKPKLTLSGLPKEVYIPVGYIASTTGSDSVDQVDFVTTDAAYASNLQILNMLPVDVSTGYRYLEVDATASTAGASGNVDANSVNQLTSSSLTGVVGVLNPMAMTGGADQEDDTSLRMRIMLAILGASICTEAGYLKFIIQKDYVDDAIVIGGNRPIMFRDGGYLDVSKTYVHGRGGMVDVWVRGTRSSQVSTTFNVTAAYLEAGAADILLEHQPAINVVSIKSSTTGQVLENADLYDIEYGSTASKSAYSYFKDILWDFTVTDTFPDTEMYPLDVVDPTEVELLKRRVDVELVAALDYLSNIDYSINWSLVTYEDVSKYEVKPLFQKVFYNGKPYKIIAVDARLNGRTYVKRNNRIYLRYYKQPDFVLLKTTYSDERYTSKVGADVGGSVLSGDAVHWINRNVLQEGDSLTITYNYNLLILSLQQQMNALRHLTADILIRQATSVPIQIMMTVLCDSTVTSTSVKNTIATKLTTFVNSLKRMGGSIEESELAAIARQTDGVTFVDLDSVSLSRKNSLTVPKIQLEENEYFTLDNIEVTVNSETSIVN